MKNECTDKCSHILDRKNSFDNSKDFENFFEFLFNNQNFQKITFFVDEYSNLGFDVNYFKCNICGCIWRLVAPDPPFSGVWEIVE